MKTILITGASKGIGKALSLLYSNNGYKIIAIARDENDLIELSNVIKANGNKCEYYVCDVTDKNRVKEVIDIILKSNELDISILNAGISYHHFFENFDSDILIDHYNTNIFGVMYFFEYLLPYYKSRKSGKIGVVSSLAESRGLPGSAIYCSTKIALSHLLEAARIELKYFGIKVITIKPGFVITNMTKKNNFKMPFLLEVEKSAEIIFNGIENDKKIIAFPKPMALFSYLGKVTPAIIYETVLSKFIMKFKKT